jgi:hypothetical protein
MKIVKVVKRHPILTLGAAAAGIWYFFVRKGASGAAVMSGGQGVPSISQSLVPMTPGNIPAAVQPGGELLLQLPVGATWDTQNPVTQDGGIKATVMPLVPFGAEEQIWRGVTGGGMITGHWLDPAGNEQVSTISVTVS